MNRADLTMPPLPPTRERVVTVLFQLHQSRQLERWYGEVVHAGPAGQWISDQRWLSSHAMTPDLLTEVETALVAPVEAAVMTHWGIQALLL